MNLMKIQNGVTTKFRSTVMSYLQDYYMVVDAAKEDYNVEHLQVLKAIDQYNFETDDSLIKALKRLKLAIMGKFRIEHTSDETKVEKPFD